MVIVGRVLDCEERATPEYVPDTIRLPTMGV
jgi:hypothetical protein